MLKQSNIINSKKCIVGVIEGSLKFELNFILIYKIIIMVCESQVYDDYIIAIQVYFTFLFYYYCDFLFLLYFISLFITNTRVILEI